MTLQGFPVGRGWWRTLLPMQETWESQVQSPGGGDSKPLLYSCLENPMDRGAWQATVHKVTKSWIRLKRLSMPQHSTWMYSPTPGHISGEKHSLKRYMHPSVHFRTVYSCQDIEATLISINRGMDKEGVLHIYNGTLLSQGREWNNAICSNMGGPRDFHAKWS